MKAMRVGVVGAGAVGARHARVLGRLPGVRLAAVADTDTARARALAADLGARVCGDHEELLDVGALDAVYVCVPPFAHGEIERAVLAAGHAMFVEKPLAADLETAEEISDLVERAGVVTGTGYHWRCLDTLQEARALLAERPPLLLQASYVGPRPSALWWSRRSGSGGQLVEQATHVLDVVRVLAGEVVRVEAAASGRIDRDPTSDVDEAGVATLRFASGAVGAVVCSSLAAAPYRAGVEAIADGLVVELTETELAVVDGRGRRSRRARVDPRLEVDRAFIEAVRGGVDGVRVPYAEALHTHRLACALQRSADEGTSMSLA
jgi:myo-inositol 2-dehydrogenase/D-chiro-inositol 1-dehydrogenase